MLTIFDLEVTAWPGSMARRWTGPGEHPEIIQIGAVRLDHALVETGSLNLLVRPRLNPILSPYIVALTGVTQDRIDAEGLAPAEAFGRFATFIEGCRMTLCNGGDAAWLARNLAINDLAPVFASVRFGDLSAHFRAATGGESHVTSSHLPALLGFAMPGRAHDGLADARAIAEALRRTLPAGGVPALLAGLGA